MIMEKNKKKKIIDIIITILCAIGGFFASCTTTYIIQKGNGNIDVEQTTKNNQKADSTQIKDIWTK